MEKEDNGGGRGQVWRKDVRARKAKQRGAGPAPPYPSLSLQELMQEEGISGRGMEMTCLGRQSREVARGEPCRHVRRDDGLWRTHIIMELGEDILRTIFWELQQQQLTQCV